MNVPSLAQTILEAVPRGGLLERLLFSSLEFAALALAVSALILLFRLRQPRLRALLWLMVLAKPLAGLALGTPLPLFFLPAPAGPAAAALVAPAPVAAALVAPAQPAALEIERAPADWRAPAVAGVQAPEPAPIAAPQLAPPPAPAVDHRALALHAVGSIWMAVCLILAGRLGLNTLRLRRLIRAAAPPTPWFAERLTAAAAQLKLTHTPPLLITRELESPALAGFWRPVILLPEWVAAEADPARVDWSLRHELMHWHLRDPLAAFVRELVLILFFFHPAAWWAGRKWKEATELACDRALIRSMEDAASYAEELYRMLVQIRELGGRQARRRLPVAGGLFAGRTQIARRIASLARDPLRTPAHLSAAGLCAVLALSAISMLFGVGVSSRAEDAQKSLPSPQPGLIMNGVGPKPAAAERVRSTAKSIRLEKDESLRLEGDARYGVDFGAFAAAAADSAIKAAPERNGFVTLTADKTPLAARERDLTALAQAGGTGNPLECVWMAGDKVEIDLRNKECRPQGNAVLVQKKGGELWVYRSSIIFLHEDAAGQPVVGIGKAIGGYNGPALSVIKYNAPPAIFAIHDTPSSIGKGLWKTFPAEPSLSNLKADSISQEDGKSTILMGQTQIPVQMSLTGKAQATVMIRAHKIILLGDQIKISKPVEGQFVIDITRHDPAAIKKQLSEAARQNSDPDPSLNWASANRVIAAPDTVTLDGDAVFTRWQNGQAFEKGGRLINLHIDQQNGGLLTQVIPNTNAMPAGKPAAFVTPASEETQAGVDAIESAARKLVEAGRFVPAIRALIGGESQGGADQDLQKLLDYARQSPARRSAAADLLRAANLNREPVSYSPRDEEQGLPQKIAAEDITTCVNEFVNQFFVGFAGQSSVVPMNRIMLWLVDRDPHVRKILTYARQSTARRQEVIALLKARYDDYFNRYPLIGEQGKPYAPSAASPGGIVTFPYILAQLEAVDLDVLAAAIRRHQQAIRQELRSRENGSFIYPPGEFIAGAPDTITAYAADHELNRIAEDPARWGALNAAQRAVLQSYQEFRVVQLKAQADAAADTLIKDNLGLPELDRYLTQIMQFIMDFVAAGKPAHADLAATTSGRATILKGSIRLFGPSFPLTFMFLGDEIKISDPKADRTLLEITRSDPADVKKRLADEARKRDPRWGGSAWVTAERALIFKDEILLDGDATLYSYEGNQLVQNGAPLMLLSVDPATQKLRITKKDQAIGAGIENVVDPVRNMIAEIRRAQAQPTPAPAPAPAPVKDDVIALFDKIQALSITSDPASGQTHYRGKVLLENKIGSGTLVIAGDRVTVNKKDTHPMLAVAWDSTETARATLLDLARKAPRTVPARAGLWATADSVDYDEIAREWTFDGHFMFIARSTEMEKNQINLFTAKSPVKFSLNANDTPKIAAQGGFLDCEEIDLDAEPATASAVKQATPKPTEQEAIITDDKNPGAARGGGGQLGNKKYAGSDFDLMYAKNIESDPKGITVLRGDVRLESKDLKISADEVKIDQAAHTLYATGKPVQIEQQGGAMQAQCRKLTYDLATNSATLEDEAVITQEGKGQKKQAAADVIRIEYPAAKAGQDPATIQPRISLMNRDGSGSPPVRIRNLTPSKFEDLKALPADPKNPAARARVTTPAGDIEASGDSLSYNMENKKIYLTGKAKVDIRQGADPEMRVSATADRVFFEVRNGYLSITLDGQAVAIQDPGGQKLVTESPKISVIYPPFPESHGKLDLRVAPWDPANVFTKTLATSTSRPALSNATALRPISKIILREKRGTWSYKDDSKTTVVLDPAQRAQAIDGQRALMMCINGQGPDSYDAGFLRHLSTPLYVIADQDFPLPPGPPEFKRVKDIKALKDLVEREGQDAFYVELKVVGVINGGVVFNYSASVVQKNPRPMDYGAWGHYIVTREGDTIILTCEGLIVS